mgnify:CR=1 FL=1
MIFHIKKHDDVPVGVSLSKVSVQDDNLTLTLENENITVETNGEWIGDIKDLIQMLHDLIEMKGAQNGQ